MKKRVKTYLLIYCVFNICLIMIIVVKSRRINYEYESGNFFASKKNKYRDSRIKRLSSKQLLKNTLEIEQIEEKMEPKDLQAYSNEIILEETAVRLFPSQEREIGVTLNVSGSASVKVSSSSKDVTIINNAIMNINEENFNDPFRRFKIKVSDSAKENQKVKVSLSASGLKTKTVYVSIDSRPKDTKNISFYHDMVPGMTFSTTFMTSLITNQEKQFLDYTYKIKNFGKDVLIEKDGEIRAWNVGDAVISIKYNNKVYKVYVRVRAEELYPEPNKEETSIHFINPIEEALEVGEEYSLMAVTLPHMYTKKNDNYFNRLIIYETSDPKVCTVAYGSVRAEGVGKCTITAYNKSKTLSTSIDITVVHKKEIKYTSINTMNITPEVANQYGLSNSNGRATTEGLKKIVEEAKKQGKKRVYFTKALDLIMEPYGDDNKQVRLASDTMYDFNGTKIHVPSHQCKDAELGYHMFTMDGVQGTILKNLNMTGSKPNGGCLVSFPDAIECTVEGCKLGNNYYNIAAYSGYFDEGHMKEIKANIFKFGNIRSDGTLSESKCRVRSDFIDITHIDAAENFMVGDFNEFSNYKNAPSLLYDIAYYDKDKKFIKKDSVHAQYFPYYRPKEATYCRIVFHTDELPTDSTQGYYTGYCFRIGHIKQAYKCTIKDNVLYNARHINLGLFGEQRCVIDGNYFYTDGDHGTDIDWEDFFHAKACDITKNNVFTTSYNGISVVSGMGYVFRNNAFYHQAYVTIHGDIRYFRFFGNVMKRIPVEVENCYDSIINNNIFGCPLYFKSIEAEAKDNGIMPRLRIENNTNYDYMQAKS